MVQPGTTLAHYRLVEKIGQGGMGEVFRAEDTKLGREVAIKVLPEMMAADADRLARFEREARSLAALNHPNIAAIYGLEEADDTRFLVLELVPGETLAEHIERGPIPVEQALQIARQIAEGMAEAHAAGILHRDLKPANVKVTPDGKVKVLDFGLAKPFLPDPASGSPDLTQSPTLTFAGATQAGMLLGTAAYMSPEQARGQAVDRRADIWAFGVVLFEMLAGARMFGGGTVSDTLASVLKEEPGWDALPSGTPPAARRLLRRALEKDPARRLRDIIDARLEIDDALNEPVGVADSVDGPGASTGGAPALLPWAVALVAVAAAVWFGFVGMGGDAKEGPAPRVAAAILPPPETGFDLSDGMALSPDGKRLAFATRGADGETRLWVRHLDRTVAEPVVGTEGGEAPFWSPDGRELGFLAEDRLKRINLASGAVETLADVAFRRGAAWSTGGDIVFLPRWGSPLHRVLRTGGAAEPVTVLEVAGGDTHYWPSFLPDGRRFLYLVRTYGRGENRGQIRLGSLDDPTGSKLLFPSNSNAVYVPPGYILWWHDGNLRAQRFDADRGELSGEPFALIPGVRFDPRIGLAAFTVSNNGVLIYQEGGTEAGNQLVWYDRQGNELGPVGPAGSLYTPTLSPDGSRIVLDISGETNQGDIWILDVERGSGTRFTTFAEDDSKPIFSDDGDSVAFFSMHETGRPAVWIKPVRGGQEPRLVVQDADADLVPHGWHGDLLLVERNHQAQVGLWTYSLADEKLEPYVDTEFTESAAALSADGRFAAYHSDESGRNEVYVQGFPSGGERWSVSPDGGKTPRWRADGKELYYVSLDDEIMAVAVTTDAAGRLEFSVPVRLFRVDIKQSDNTQFDSADGERFLVNTNIRAGAADPLTLVLNWQEGLER